jgi:AcrR family transcriptional regulator
MNPGRDAVETRMTQTKRGTRADGEATRKRLLEIAGERFAASGYAETKGKEIAARAEVDLASINYHFGSRAGLYQAVLAEAHRRFAAREDIERIVAADLPAEDRLRDLVRFLLAGASGEAEWPMVVLGREVISPSSHLTTLQQDEVAPKLQAILPLLSEISGVPTGDPVLVRCLTCIATPCAVIALVGRVSTPFTDRLRGTSHTELVEQLSTYAIGGLRAVGARSRAGR